MHARQILLYVSKLLKPYEICIRSYRRKAYYKIQLDEFDAWIQRKNKQDIYYKRRDEHSESEDEGNASS